MTSTATNSFRLSAKQLLLTYPRCLVEKGSALATLMEKLARWEPAMMIVAKESHQDGESHLHCLVKLKKKCDIRNASALDLNAETHGNYVPRRNWKSAVEYVCKEDPEPATFGVPDLASYRRSLKNKKSTDLALVAGGIMDGSLKDTAHIFAEHPSLLLSHKRQVEDAVEWVKERKRLRPTKVWEPFCLDRLEGVLWEVADWCNLNLGLDREFKQKQLWIVSPPDCGKTTFCNWLAERFYTYVLPIDDAWDDLYHDDYRLVVVDEFKGQRRISWLNGFVQGGRFPVKRRGCAPFIKTNNVPVIVLSNFSPQDAYQNCPHVAWQSLMARFHVVSFPSMVMGGEAPMLFSLID